MKNFVYLISTILLFAFVLSCKKSNNNTNTGLAALNIVQATIDVPSVVVNFSDTAVPFYQNQASISYGACQEYGIPAANTPFRIVSSADTATPMWQGWLHLTTGGVYSLYLAGLATKPDTLLLQDVIPVHTDSTAGVRFINLSPDSQPISVNLAGNLPTQYEFSAMRYKAESAFKNYPDTNGVSSYNFEIRDQATGNLLTTFSWNFTLFKNNTLVINGSEAPSGTTPISVFSVNNF